MYISQNRLILKMSSLYQSSNCCLISHGKFISKVYENVSNNTNESEDFSYKLTNTLFCIMNDNNATSNRKRKNGQDIISAETLKIKTQYEIFKQEITDMKAKFSEEYDVAKTEDVRKLSQKLFEATTFNLIGKNGGNNSEKAIKCKVENEYFLVPPNCRFYCSSVKEQCSKLNNQYDILIADPPWWNKYIRRLKSANDKLSYSMMYNEDIANIPVKNLLSENCLVAVWCTNAPSCIEAVKNLIFPGWGVEYVTTWYWLKVALNLEPICNFSSGCSKQPYERLIIGKVGQVNDVPEDRIIVSVPSALHSHKPPLLDLLTPYVNVKNPQVLELFARYLLPNTTSVGYEPLKWQHESLYEMIDSKKLVM